MILTLRRTFLVAACLLAAISADAKKNSDTDAVAESIARARDNQEIFDGTAPAEAAAEESADLKEMLNDAKLVASADGVTGEAQAVVAETKVASIETTEGKGTDGKGTTQEIAAKAEKDIPVLGQNKKKGSSSESSVTRILFSLAILTIALFATTIGLKRWSKRRQGKTQHTAIKVLTQHFIGPKKSLAIVQVAGESILIGVTDNNISMLKTLSLLDEEIPEATPKDFDVAMNLNEEDFTGMNGLNEIRDKVSRSLRTMKDL